jgi:16S rRNA (uracil1498-N3)-methyltransferase
MRINSLIESGELEKLIATLSPGESHHLARVLRVEPGQAVTLFDGQGGVAEAVVETVSKSEVKARIEKRWSVPAPAVQIDLIQAVPKPDRWELVLQKAVELGVSNIQPILTRHTEFKPNPKKQARWESILLNAAQQCEVRWLPKIKPLEKMDAVLPGLSGYDLVLIGSLYEGARPLREIPLRHDSGEALVRKVALLIGPEGDFTQEEVEAALEEGAVPVSFGNRVLRTETAAIFGLSVLAYELL